MKLFAQDDNDDNLVGPENVYTVEQLKQDLKVLTDSLELLHPGLYRFHDKASFSKAVRQAMKKLDHPMNDAEFLGVVVPVADQAGDIHTSVGLTGASYSYLANGKSMLPLDVRIVGNNIYVVNDNSPGSSIGIGSKLKSINGKSVRTMLSDMQNNFTSEGDNISYKRKKIEQQFPFMFSITYGITKKFEVEYTDESGGNHKKTIDATPYRYIEQPRIVNQAKHPKMKPVFPLAPYLTFAQLENKTAILTIKSFENDFLERAGFHFKSFIDSSFNVLGKSGTESLIIDIRNNDGGESENATYLYSWLVNKPFRFLRNMETSPLNWERLSAHTKTLTCDYLPQTDRYRIIYPSAIEGLATFFGLGLQQPHENNFMGNIVVLMDGLTVSAATQFASLVKLNSRGILVGEDAPGSLYGGSGRGYAYFLLPNTNLLVMISLYRLSFFAERDLSVKTGLHPDHYSSYTINDLLDGRDKDVELSMKLITDKKLPPWK